MTDKKLTYADSGVDIEEGNRFVQTIKPLVKKTFRPEVLTGLGGFGGLFELQTAKYKQPVLVSSTDGVGTKLKVAFMMDSHETVGIDLVAMCVNDILVQGAEPLFFLDYFATGALSSEKAATVVKGITDGCSQAGCALIGGETAEMPGFYGDGEYDLSGFSVGVVDRDKIIDGSTVSAGDAVIGLKSSGIHSNGYSLARKVIFDILGLNGKDLIEGTGKTVGESLLTPTKIYVKAVLPLLEKFNMKGMAHITGGGLIENIPRILPDGLNVTINTNSWEIPPLFRFIQKGGDVDEMEMFRVFNCGIGFVLIVPSEEAQQAVNHLTDAGEEAVIIGTVQASQNDEKRVVLK
ncbi:MAG: phosphoribosylformylglycinamidine cyclo-ligase [Deltaproteobacteria bacterium]|nr:phosphoribosylformylglycinamidine cyclo-ligase [Deltaproteobacteria bacterium]